MFNLNQIIAILLFNQGYVVPKLQSSLLKFYGRHHDLADKYDKTVSQMKEDLFS